jgi:hypothetical protein
MRLFICAAILAVAAHPAGAQEKKKSADNRPVITVTGCVDGSWLQVKGGSYTERYKLRGAKQMLKELASQYKGHLIEVTGSVTDTGNSTHLGKTIPIGKKTRITTGAKEVPQVPSGSDATLDVGSYRDLKPSCG